MAWAAPCRPGIRPRGSRVRLCNLAPEDRTTVKARAARPTLRGPAAVAIGNRAQRIPSRRRDRGHQHPPPVQGIPSRERISNNPATATCRRAQAAAPNDRNPPINPTRADRFRRFRAFFAVRAPLPGIPRFVGPSPIERLVVYQFDYSGHCVGSVGVLDSLHG